MTPVSCSLVSGTPPILKIASFERSARQAGFFAASEDRLIEPIIGRNLQSDQVRVMAQTGASFEVNTGGHPQARADLTKFHPFTQGLLDSLPEPNSNWALEGRAKWLQAAALNFDLMYKGGNGEIKISASFKAENSPDGRRTSEKIKATETA